MATLIGYGVFIIVVVLGMTFDFNDMSGNITSVVFFIDPASLLLVVPGAFGFALVAGKAHPATLSVVLGGGIKQDAPGARAFLNAFGVFSLLTGLFGAFIGLILMFQGLDDHKKIGPAMAIVLLSMLYGSLLKVVCDFAEERVRMRHNLPPESSEINAGLWIMAIYPLIAMLAFFVLSFAFLKG